MKVKNTGTVKGVVVNYITRRHIRMAALKNHVVLGAFAKTT